MVFSNPKLIWALWCLADSCHLSSLVKMWNLTITFLNPLSTEWLLYQITKAILRSLCRLVTLVHLTISICTTYIPNKKHFQLFLGYLFNIQMARHQLSDISKYGILIGINFQLREPMVRKRSVIDHEIYIRFCTTLAFLMVYHDIVGCLFLSVWVSCSPIQILYTPQIPPIPFKVLCKCLLRKLFLID